MKTFSLRRAIGTFAAVVASVLMAWLVLVLLSAAPAPELRMLEQSGVRLLAELTVVSLLVAAIGFWDEE